MDVVMPRSGQLYDMAKGAMKELTFLPVGTLLIGGEGGVCISRV